jgi:hypothetical protein
MRQVFYRQNIGSPSQINFEKHKHLERTAQE